MKKIKEQEKGLRTEEEELQQRQRLLIEEHNKDVGKNELLVLQHQLSEQHQQEKQQQLQRSEELKKQEDPLFEELQKELRRENSGIF